VTKAVCGPAGSRAETRIVVTMDEKGFPNYLVVAIGTFETCLACSSSADNVFHQLGVAGRSWKAYNQSMPHSCAANTSSVPYYRSGHNPAFWFADLAPAAKGGDGSCPTNDVPLDPALWNDIAADRLPSLAWVAPDDCRDMHWMNGTCESVTGQDPGGQGQGRLRRSDGRRDAARELLQLEADRRGARVAPDDPVEVYPVPAVVDLTGLLDV